MNATLKKYLNIAARHAVNASLLSLFQIFHDPQDNNFHNWHGIQGILWAVGGAVLAREVVVWFPKLLKWSQDVPQDVTATVETTTRITPTDLSQPATVTKTSSEVLSPAPEEKPKP